MALHVGDFIACEIYGVARTRVGGDHYNPFTNTISLYSDIPAVAIHEGGHAKDFAQRTYKGTYAAAYVLLPGVPLYHEAKATSDALAYIREHETFEQEREAYRTLYIRLMDRMWVILGRHRHRTGGLSLGCEYRRWTYNWSS